MDNSSNKIDIDEKFRAVFETTPDTIIIIDENNTIVYCNENIRNTFGYEPAELIDRSMSIIVPVELRERHEKGIKRFLKDGIPKLIGKTIEIFGLRKNGTTFPMELSLSYWKEDEKVFFSSIIRDVSERKRILQELELLQSITQSINESHDFEKAISVALQKVCGLTGWEFGEAWVPNETRSELIFHSWYAKDETFNAIAFESKNFKLKPGEGIPGRAFNNSVEWIKDVSKLPIDLFPRVQCVTKTGLKAALGIPVVDNEEVMASFAFYMIEERDEDEQLIKVIASIAKQLGSVIKRKKAETEIKNLNLDLKEHKEELQVTIEELNEQIEVRKETESALKKERNYLKAVLGNMKEGIVACDENGTLSFFNDASRRLHEITEKSLPPSEWAKNYSLYHSDGITLMKTEELPLYRAYKGEEVNNIEMVIISSDGQKRDILASGERITSEDGKTLGAVCVLHDITQRKRDEELKKQLLIKEATIQEAKRQEEILFKLFQEVPAPVALQKGKELKYVLVNKQYQDIIFPGRKLLNLPLLEAVPEIENAPIMDIINNVYASGERYVGNEVPIDLDRGKGILEKSYFNFVYEPTFSKEGQPDGMFTFAYEVTDLVVSRNSFEELSKELAAANEEIQASLDDLARSNQKLEKANIDLDNFIYTASHDLKTPVVNLEGLFILLKNEFGGKFDLFGKNILEMMEKSIRQLQKTIFDLTQITIAQKDINNEFSQISFKEIINEVLIDIHPLIESSNAVIEKNIQAETIYFNKSSIRSVLYNLLTNAIKYTSEERPLQICITTSTEENYLTLSVKDNGLGIDKHQLPKVFSMFRRFHSHVEGTGIGLYIIKRLVENRGGSIAVESEEGKGSTFKVYFPLNPTEDKNVSR